MCVTILHRVSETAAYHITIKLGNIHGVHYINDNAVWLLITSHQEGIT